ncbi:type II toxin-antitoxin system VapB family antitoxin [Nocardioidaceae bacterium SCSIO 66511]|nr:type II toxin-antitoxin system VapB family antitoxin [Nocardioidaceae bacterium SCSIO 66511]
MRTTIRVDDELLTQAKALAAHSRRSLSAVVEDALREMLAHHETPAHVPVELPTFRGNGVRRGVDLADTAGLYDLMDVDEAS